MDVVLLVYDLSQGLARQLSAGLLGFQLDAVYHTSIRLNGREYVYDGGIVEIVPESSHLGHAMERITLGKTELPMEVINEYLDSIREVFTFEAYDLFTHNCNNFTDSFAKFLLGTGIPSRIIDMPRRVLASPMGHTLYQQMAQSVRSHRDQRHGPVLGIGETASTPPNPPPAHPQSQSTTAAATAAAASAAAVAQAARSTGVVHEPTSLAELQALIRDASSSCAVVFFTSPTCGPCRALVAPFASLAADLGSRCRCIKVDTSRARDAGAHFDIRATPTFITFLRGEQERRWAGADAAVLRGNVMLLVQMAWPPHPHWELAGDTFRNGEGTQTVSFARTPPLTKLLSKLGAAAQESTVRTMVAFLETRDKSGTAEALLPDLEAFGKFARGAVATLPPDALFAVVDLLRCAVLDPRVGAHFVAENAGNDAQASTDVETLLTIIRHVNQDGDRTPYALRLVTLHLACNMFATRLFALHATTQTHLREALTSLLTSSLLDAAHPASRAAAASLAFNIALADRRTRGVDNTTDGRVEYDDDVQGVLPEDEQVELAAALVEAIRKEGGEGKGEGEGESMIGGTSGEVLRAMLVALGQLAWCRDQTGEAAELLRAVGAEETVLAKKDNSAFKGQTGLIEEVGKGLLGKWLNGTSR